MRLPEKQASEHKVYAGGKSNSFRESNSYMETHCELRMASVLAYNGTAIRQKVEDQMCCFLKYNLCARHITFIH